MAVWFFSMHCQTLVNIYCWKKRLCTARSDKQMRESGKLSPHRVRNSFRWGGRAEEGTIDSENCHLRLILCPPPSPSVLFFFFLSPSPLREEFLSPHRRPDPQLPPPPPLASCFPFFTLPHLAVSRETWGKSWGRAEEEKGGCG